MYKGYVIEPIDRRTIDKAYPLAKLVAPDLPQLEWREFCQSCEPSTVQRNVGEGERIVVVLNAKRYVKGLGIYAIRNHATYGRLIDVPLLLTASAADGEGVAAALVGFVVSKCDDLACSGIRFWATNSDTWAHRREPDRIARSDHGVFMPARASAVEIKNALCAQVLEGAEAIDRLSR
jgi:hypothetical protein